MKRFLLAALVLSAFGAAAFGIAFKKIPEVEKIFRDRSMLGTFVMFDAAGDTMFVWNDERAKQQFAPASTFRIANALLALDAGIVKSLDEAIPYHSKQYRNDESAVPYFYGGPLKRDDPWNRKLELRKAMRVPYTSIFRGLARQLGIQQMRDGMTKLAYGNMQVGHQVDRCWRDGTLRISAIEQAEFLAKLAQGKLPVTQNALEKTRELTLSEKTETYRLYSKSGSLVTAESKRLGWWIGWIERENKVFSFALNIDMTGSPTAQAPGPIGRECLKALGKL